MVSNNPLKELEYLSDRIASKGRRSFYYLIGATLTSAWSVLFATSASSSEYFSNMLAGFAVYLGILGILLALFVVGELVSRLEMINKGETYFEILVDRLEDSSISEKTHTRESEEIKRVIRFFPKSQKLALMGEASGPAIYLMISLISILISSYAIISNADTIIRLFF